MSILKNFWKEEAGQDLIEYTLLLAFVGLAGAAIFIPAGGHITGVWGIANDHLSNAAGAASGTT